MSALIGLGEANPSLQNFKEFRSFANQLARSARDVISSLGNQ